MQGGERRGEASRGGLSAEAGDCLRLACYVESWLQPDSEIWGWEGSQEGGGKRRTALICWLCGAFSALAAHSWCASHAS